MVRYISSLTPASLVEYIKSIYNHCTGELQLFQLHVLIGSAFRSTMSMICQTSDGQQQLSSIVDIRKTNRST